MKNPDKKDLAQRILDADPELIKRARDVRAKRDSKKFFCYHCNAETNHNILFEKGELIFPQEIVVFDDKGKRSHSEWGIEGQIWKISECQGCEKN